MNDLRKRLNGLEKQHIESKEKYEVDRKDEKFIISKIPLPVVACCVFPDI